MASHNSVSVEFRLLVGEETILIDKLLKNPQRLIDYYLEEENQSDSTFQGGYCITVDGKIWNGNPDFYFDIFSFTLNWLSGVDDLLSGKTSSADVGFWEESVATAT